jgi:hypothetical protein
VLVEVYSLVEQVLITVAVAVAELAVLESELMQLATLVLVVLEFLIRFLEPQQITVAAVELRFMERMQTGPVWVDWAVELMQLEQALVQ